MNPPRSYRFSATAVNLLMMIAAITLSGCGDHNLSPPMATSRGTALNAVDLSNPAHPTILRDGIAISTARNAWGQWALQIDGSQLPARPRLRLPVFAPEISLSAYQVLPAPVNLNDAEFVRQTGDRADVASVPRVLLPLPMTGNAVDLSALRNPYGKHSSINGPVQIWIDLHADAHAFPHSYQGNCELVDARGGGESAGAVPIRLTVENLLLPAYPHLRISASLNWQTLATIYPDAFRDVTPRLLNRNDPRHAAVISILESYVQLAHANKADVYVPRLQPIVKWPLGKPPVADWAGFDSVVSPWCSGQGFADQVPIGFWPLPVSDSLAGFDLRAQAQYWHVAAEHFDQHLWLDRSPVVLKTDTGEAVNNAGEILLSAEAREILASHPRICTLLPMQDDQLQLESSANSAGIPRRSTNRLCTLAPGVVCASPIANWPPEAMPPQHWIDSQSQTAAGVAGEEAMRIRAWLAFSRDASLLLCGESLPSSTDPMVPGRANQSPWFYPGQWYGSTAPLATLQLKWIRQAEQDYEYLYLASQRKDRTAALKMCQLITRPLQLQPAQPTESVFNLLAGSTEPHACEGARQLLVSRLLRPAKPDAIADTATDAVELQTLRWFTDRQHSTIAPASVRWMWNLDPRATSASPRISSDAGNWIDAVVTCNLYNPSDGTAIGSDLEWTLTPPGWEDHPLPVDVPPLAKYQSRTVSTTARFNLGDITPESRQPLELTFVDGSTSRSLSTRMMLPVAISERREQPIKIDGDLDDWYAADSIQLDQPLVRMLDRPGIQSPELPLADTNSSIFTAWSNDNFYIAFKLGGVTAADLRSTRNFAEYDHGRAWGEDLCEVLIQPIYLDNTTGPMLHIVAKPAGEWVEDQLTPDSPWLPFEASGLRYAAGVDPPTRTWRGELAIPWKAIQSSAHGRPTLMRFNFIQHQNSTGQSASWAGPIDQSRDGKMTGLLLLKEP